MSYWKIKNLKIDKKNNKISGLVADSSIRDWKDRMVYDRFEDLYSSLECIEDKICALYYDLICGNIHIDYGKYKNYICKFDYFKDFIEDYRKVSIDNNKKKYDYYNVYLKHKDKIEDFAKEDCVLKQKGYSNRYIVRENKCSVSMNYGIEKAKKFSSKRVMLNDWLMENYDIIYI